VAVTTIRKIRCHQPRDLGTNDLEWGEVNNRYADNKTIKIYSKVTRLEGVMKNTTNNN